MLSVIIPVRNSHAFIGECLRSILSQDAPVGTYEVLISDNASSDETVKTVEAILPLFEEAGVKARLFQQKENLGAYGNLNFLLNECANDHAQILCADDYFNDAAALSHILGIIAKYPSVAIFAFDNNSDHTGGLHWKLIRECRGDGEIDSLSVAKLLFCFGCFLGGLSNICLRRSAFGGRYFNPEYRYWGDLELYARAAMEGATVHLSRRQTTVRREHAKSISSTSNAGNRASHEAFATVSALFDYLREKGCSPRAMRLYATCQITQFYHSGMKELLLRGDFGSLQNVMRAQRGSAAHHSPALSGLLAVIFLPKSLRNPLLKMRENRFARHLLSH
jgi:glycosyltransferase involved in cell wall biosynthesis